MKATKPQLIKTAADIFTDREEPRRAFWNLYKNMESGDIEILHFYGTGGIGKTTLLKKIQSEMLEEGNDRYIYYSFENLKSKADILADFTRLLKEKLRGIEFPIFDYAYIKYKEKSGADAKVLREKQHQTFMDNQHVETVVDVMTEVIPYSGLLAKAVKKGVQMTHDYAKEVEQRSGINSGIYSQIEHSSSTELFRNLHKYFAYDAYDYFEKADKPFVIMLDAYESLVNKLEKGDKASSDDLWLREEESLIRSLPNVLWIVAGRERLEWEKELLDSQNTHLIGNLSETDSLLFFHKSGVNDDTLCKGLYELTAGTPVYMDLCIKTYNRIKAKNGSDYMPQIEEFGHNTEELAARYLKDMSISEQNLVKLISCLPNIWDDEMVESVAKKLRIDFSQGEYRLIKELSLVENDENDEGFYKLHETFRNVVIARIDEEELHENIIEVANYINGRIDKYIIEGDYGKLYSTLRSFLAYLKKFSDFISVGIDGATNLIVSLELIIDCSDEETCRTLLQEIRNLIDEIVYEEEEHTEAIIRWQKAKAYITEMFGHYFEALEYLRECYESTIAYYGDNHLETCKALIGYANICEECCEYENAKALCKSAMQILEHHPEEELELKLKIYRILHGIAKGTDAKDLEFIEREHILWVQKYCKEIEVKEGRISFAYQWALNEMYDAYFEAKQYQKALEIATEKYEIAESFEPGKKENRLHYLSEKATCLKELKQEEKALEVAQEHYDLCCEYYGENDERSIRARRNQIMIWYRLGDYEKTLELIEPLYTVSVNNEGEENADSMLILSIMTDLYMKLEKDINVIPMCQEVYEFQKKEYGENSLEAVVSLKQLAQAYEREEEYTAALECYRRFKEALKSTGDIIEINEISWKIAVLLRELGQYEEALAVHKENKAIVESSEDLDEYDLCDELYGIACCYYKLKQFESAVSVFEEYLTLSNEIDFHDYDDEIMYKLGYAHIKMKEYDKSIEWLEKAYQIVTEYESDEENILDIMSLKGVAYAEKEEYATAHELWKQCYEGYKKLKGEDVPKTIREAKRCAMLLEALESSNSEQEQN